MAKIPYPIVEGTPSKVREFFDKILANSPRILNVNLMMAHSPGSVRELIRLGNRLLSKADLSPRFHELTIIRVSRLCGSNYELAQHIPIALEAGLSRDQIEMIEKWEDSELFSEEEKIILAFTEEVVQDNRPKEETFAAASGFLDHTSLVELTISIGYWSLIAKFLRTFQVDIEEDILSKYGDLLADKGSD